MQSISIAFCLKWEEISSVEETADIYKEKSLYPAVSNCVASAFIFLSVCVCVCVCVCVHVPISVCGLGLVPGECSLGS